MCSSKKLNQRGGFFVEYALILAFVVICGNALLTNNEISLKINNIFSCTTDLLQKAIAKVAPNQNVAENETPVVTGPNGSQQYEEETGTTDIAGNTSVEPPLEK